MESASFGGPPWKTSISALLCFAKQPGTQEEEKPAPWYKDEEEGPRACESQQEAELGMHPVLRDRVQIKSWGDTLENIF